MNKPDPESSDRDASQDDAVWLDLVSRLQEEPRVPPHEQGRRTGSGPGEGPVSSLPPQTFPAEEPGFADFDPLGLAGAAPLQPPAAERGRRGGPAGPDETGPRDYIPDDMPDEFIPEDPPSLAGTDPLTMLAWLGAVGGPVTLLMFAMFWRAAPLSAILGVIAAFIAAAGYLIMRLPEDKNDFDDGARV